MCESKNLLLHPFEQAGLGLAPFYFVALRKNVYSAAPGHTQAGGSCDYCGTGIMYECVIKSSDGKEFVVGMDCVRKTLSESNRILTAMERALAKMNQEKKDAERKAKWEEANRKREAELDRQRAVNGGLTDYEVEQAKQKAQEQAQYEANEWLIKVIEKYPGDFASSMVDRLEVRPLGSLSPRMIEILCDMYAKSKGRRGSKAYNAAEDFFNAKCSETVSE